MSVTPDVLRQAMGQLASGVAIATAEVAGVPIGMTISSFNSLSLDPPLVLFSVARSSLAISAWLVAEHFAINLLADSQAHLASRFAAARGDKWGETATRRGRFGAPLIDDAMVQFEAAVRARHEGGDHVILVGQVLAMQSRDDARPLLFYRRRFCALADLNPTLAGTV